MSSKDRIQGSVKDEGKRLHVTIKKIVKRANVIYEVLTHNSLLL